MKGYAKNFLSLGPKITLITGDAKLFQVKNSLMTGYAKVFYVHALLGLSRKKIPYSWQAM